MFKPYPRFSAADELSLTSESFLRSQAGLECPVLPKSIHVDGVRYPTEAHISQTLPDKSGATPLRHTQMIVATDKGDREVLYDQTLHLNTDIRTKGVVTVGMPDRTGIFMDSLLLEDIAHLNRNIVIVGDSPASLNNLLQLTAAACKCTDRTLAVAECIDDACLLQSVVVDGRMQYYSEANLAMLRERPFALIVTDVSTSFLAENQLLWLSFVDIFQNKTRSVHLRGYKRLASSMLNHDGQWMLTAETAELGENLPLPGIDLDMYESILPKGMGSVSKKMFVGSLAKSKRTVRASDRWDFGQFTMVAAGGITSGDAHALSRSIGTETVRLVGENGNDEGNGQLLHRAVISADDILRPSHGHPLLGGPFTFSFGGWPSFQAYLYPPEETPEFATVYRRMAKPPTTDVPF